MENEKQNGKSSQTKERCAIWRRRTLLERYLILICIAVFIALLVTIGFTLHEKHIYKRPLTNICLTPECTQEAERIINYMDTSVDPCEDFYNFSCGSYSKTYSDADEAQTSMIRLIKELLQSETKEEEESFGFLKKVKRFYQSCLNTSKDTMKLIKEFLEKTKFGTWPIREQKETYPNSIEKSFAISYIYGHVNPFLQMSRRMETTLGPIFFYSGEIFVPEEVFLNETDMKYIAKKKNYIEVLEYTMFNLNVPFEDMDYLVDEIIEFETELARAHLKRKHRQNIMEKDQYIDTTLKEFSSNCTGVKWLFIIRNIFDHFGHSKDFNEEIPVRYTRIGYRYVEDLCKLLGETSDRIIYNYLVWSLLVQELSTLHLFYRNYLMKIKYDDDSSLDRWKFCVLEINYGAFQPAASYLVLRHSQPEETKKEVEGYVEELKGEMVHMLQNNTWMSSFSKNSARNKLELVRHAISHSPKSLDVKLIEDYFEQFNVSDDFLENQLMILEKDIERDFFGGIRDFEDDVGVSNPLSIFQLQLSDKKELPFGYLMTPNFLLGMPKYYNYGSIGFDVAHTFAEAIINLGHLDRGIYDVSEETRKQFKQRERCYIDWYSNFPLEHWRSEEDRTLIIMDNISGHVAIGQAFKAYEKYLKKNGPEQKLPGLDFTNEQMFFIRYGQTLCVPIKSETYFEFRYSIIGILRNVPRFSEVFKCPVNTAMNPKHKCHMFDR